MPTIMNSEQAECSNTARKKLSPTKAGCNYAKERNALDGGDGAEDSPPLSAYCPPTQALQSKRPQVPVKRRPQKEL
jgi:hypothetical protein